MIQKVIFSLFAVVVLVLVFAFTQFNFMVNKEVATLSSENLPKTEIITTEMLRGLPQPVQRYLLYSGVIGKPWINTVKLQQTGQMKTAPEGKWFPFVAEEYYSVNPPGFIWQVKGPQKWLPFIQGRDGYRHGKGQLLIKLFSFFPVANAESTELDQGAMMRYLNEMMWFPTAFLGDNISWKPIDNNSAQVTLTDNNKEVTAIMYFDDEGKLTNFVAKRYFLAGKNFSLETWETPISKYGKINEFNLPTKGSATWKLKNGDFQYINISINEIKYD